MKKENLIAMPLFFNRYIDLVSNETTLLDGLENTKSDFEKVKDLLNKHENYCYAEGKWTPNDILQHIIDNERIQTYRALVFSRNDTPTLPGYDENLYADSSNAKNRTVDDLLEEFQLVRQSSISLFKGFTQEMFHRKGICFEIEVTPLALGFQLIGHQTHHLAVLNERYFI